MFVLPSSATVAAHTELYPNVTVLGTSVSPFFVLHILPCSVLFCFNNGFCIVACYNHTVRLFVACDTFNPLCYPAGTHSANDQLSRRSRLDFWIACGMLRAVTNRC